MTEHEMKEKSFHPECLNWLEHCEGSMTRCGRSLKGELIIVIVLSDNILLMINEP